MKQISHFSYSGTECNTAVPAARWRKVGKLGAKCAVKVYPAYDGLAESVP